MGPKAGYNTQTLLNIRLCPKAERHNACSLTRPHHPASLSLTGRNLALLLPLLGQRQTAGISQQVLCNSNPSAAAAAAQAFQTLKHLPQVHVVHKQTHLIVAATSPSSFIKHTPVTFHSGNLGRLAGSQPAGQNNNGSVQHHK